jgi:hypothetical protein
MYDYKGCLHIHSTESDGDVSLPEIIEAARDAGLDFIVMTDHAPLPVVDSRPTGWQGNVLVAIGLELSAGGQHCVILGPEPRELSRQTNIKPRDEAIECLQSIRRDGGIVFVAHPHTFKKRLLHLGPPGWHDWDIDAFDGIEIWPYMHDWIRDLKLRNFISHIRHPDRWITGPEPDVLKHWDQVGRRRRCVGLGALDNHARRLPFRRWGPALVEIFHHDYCFRTIRNHVLASDPFCGDANIDCRTLFNLLASGRSDVSDDYLADATGFLFTATREGKTFHMGDEVLVGGSLSVDVTCPADGTIRLLRDGEEIGSARGCDFEATVDKVGVYRVEVHLAGLPWIFSNPIYVRNVGEPASSPR